MVRDEYISKESFEFEAGGRLDALKIVFHRSEQAWVAGDSRKVIWICHALTANSDPCDWWPQMVGEGRLLDTGKYFVVCVNMLASPYGSSGPSSINPDTGKPYYFDFPHVTVRDIVKANELVRRHLGIDKIDIIIGSSIGGFQAIEWTIMYPQAISNAVFMATSARVTPWLTAYNESMRMALEADPTFHECGSLKGGEAWRIHNIRTTGQMKQLHMTGCVAATAKCVADLSHLKMKLRVQCVEDAGFSNA